MYQGVDDILLKLVKDNKCSELSKKVHYHVDMKYVGFVTSVFKKNSESISIEKAREILLEMADYIWHSRCETKFIDEYCTKYDEDKSDILEKLSKWDDIFNRFKVDLSSRMNKARDIIHGCKDIAEVEALSMDELVKIVEGGN